MAYHHQIYFLILPFLQSGWTVLLPPMVSTGAEMSKIVSSLTDTQNVSCDLWSNRELARHVSLFPLGLGFLTVKSSQGS